MRAHRADILLADDDSEVRRSLADALRKTGSRITEAASGYDMLARIHERATSRASFDLIISDIRMPGFSGIEVIEALLSGSGSDYTPLISDTPIIFITGFGDREIRERASEIGATLFSKPFDIDALRDAALALVPPEDERYCDRGGEQ
ncbi:MAG: response regulator [Kofleriaceae bacterium]